MSYICYCLRSSTNVRRTYVGITNNFKRRIRQHNGKIKGGARYTHAYRPWKPLFKIYGFETKRQVLRFEWAMKHRRRSKKGASPTQIRCLTLEYLMSAPTKEKTAPMIKSLHKKFHIKVMLSKREYLNAINAKNGLCNHVKYNFQNK